MSRGGRQETGHATLRHMNVRSKDLTRSTEVDSEHARTGLPEQLHAFHLHRDIEQLTPDQVADIPKAITGTKRRGGFIWLHLIDPDEATINDARDTLGIHPLAAADVVSGRQQPKVQIFDEHLFVLLWHLLPAKDSGELTIGQTFLYIGDGWLLTVQRAEGAELTDLRALLEKSPEILRNTALAAAYTIMADVVDGYAKAAADVEAELEELEEQVFDDSTNED